MILVTGGAGCIGSHIVDATLGGPEPDVAGQYRSGDVLHVFDAARTFGFRARAALIDPIAEPAA